jgi:hypothetical protein
MQFIVAMLFKLEQIKFNLEPMMMANQAILQGRQFMDKFNPMD